MRFVLFRPCHRLATWAIAVCFLASLSGCGYAAYNRLVESRESQLRSSEKFRVLFAPSEIPGTQMRIRIPLSFPKAYSEDSPYPEDGGKISPERFNPPFLPLPGMRICYEGRAQDGDRKLPVYCYVAAVPAKAGDAEKLAAELQGALKEKLKETPDEWTTQDCVGPDGRALPWKKIRVVAEQTFRFNAGQGVAANPLPGVFELWLYDATDYIVLVGWRGAQAVEGPGGAPDPNAKGLAASIPSKPDFNELAPLTAGSLTIEAAPAAAP